MRKILAKRITTSASRRESEGLRITFRSTIAKNTLTFLDRSMWLEKLRRQSSPKKEETEPKDGGSSITIDGKAIFYGAYSRIDLGQLLHLKQVSIINSPKLRGKILIDHAHRLHSDPKQALVFEEALEVDEKARETVKLKNTPLQLPERGKSAFGETQRYIAEVVASNRTLTLVVDFMQTAPYSTNVVKRVRQTVFSEQGLGEQAAAALCRIEGLPVTVTFYDGKTQVEVGKFEITRLEPYSFKEADFDIPAGYQNITTVELLPTIIREDDGVHINIPGFGSQVVDDIELIDPGVIVGPGLEPGFPIDAGIAFRPSFFLTLGRMAESVATVLNPFSTESDLVLTVDWYEKLSERLREVGNIDPDDPLLYNSLNLGIGLQIAQQVTEIDNLDEFPELRDVLDQSQRDELQGIINNDEIPSDNRWWQFSNNLVREEIQRQYLLQVVLAPYVRDFREEVDLNYGSEESQLLMPGTEDVVLAEYFFLSESSELWIWHAFQVLNVVFSNIRLFQLEFSEDMLQEVQINEADILFKLHNERCEMRYSYTMWPSGTWQMVVTAAATLSVAFWAFHNHGFGSVWLADGEQLNPSFPEGTTLAYSVTPTVEDNRIQHDFIWNLDESIFFIRYQYNWLNPLSVPLLFIVDAVLQLYIGLGDEKVLVEKVADALQQFIFSEYLQFPAMFTIGNPNARDRASRYVADPQFVEPVLTPNDLSSRQSVYYRGIYGFAEAEPTPFNPVFPRDGAYVFHRRVLGAMIGARLRIDGRRLDVNLPNLPGAPISSLVPDEARNATLADASVFDLLVSANLMTSEARESWVAYLEFMAGLLSFLGHPDGIIELEPPAQIRVRTYLEVKEVDVDWPDGLDGLNIDDGEAEAVGPVTMTVVCHNVLDIEFRVASDGRELHEYLEFYEENVWDDINWPQGLAVPPLPSPVQVPFFDTEVSIRGYLRVGLWDQDLELSPGLPASFDFTVSDFAEAEDGDTTVTNSNQELFPEELFSEERAQIVRDAAKAFLEARVVERLERYVSFVGRYLSFPIIDAELGANWRVSNQPRTELFVRTEGDRLYLDFEIDSLIVDNLGG